MVVDSGKTMAWITPLKDWTGKATSVCNKLQQNKFDILSDDPALIRHDLEVLFPCR